MSEMPEDPNLEDGQVLEAPSETLYRVKVYKLDVEGQWIDQGTGFVACEYVEDANAFVLSVTAEAEHESLLLNSIIVKDDVYRRQQETLIVWTEPDGCNFALSFQEPDGCEEVWNRVDSFRHKLAVETVALPDPHISNLQEIENEVDMFSRTFNNRANLAQFVVSTNFIQKLVPVFTECEETYMDLDSEDALQDLFTMSSIMKALRMSRNVNRDLSSLLK